ncbi:hypothetical protein Ddye_001166 [Dipteronia dyeriana]|uniref:RNase H type-1 domain-containing protein n=1 Tax=Dipteronia dyeriana TaxID=168575 RepID=A0AAE0CT78_9ROSI|nr:hypothetical protein Ddye_001166 [Dipteronia dyeriana]
MAKLWGFAVVEEALCRSLLGSSKTEGFLSGSGQGANSVYPSLLEEFQNTGKALIANPYRPPPIKESWQSPPHGSLKLNIDAAVIQGRDEFGVGAVIRNANKDVVLALSKLMRGCFSVEVCEVVALREGLWLAKQHGLKVDWVEVDTVNVATSIQGFKPSRSNASFVFDDIVGRYRNVGISEWCGP